MNYTLISTKDYKSNQELELSKVGNGYTILLINNELSPKQIIKQSFEYLEDAQDRYSEIVKCFINGWNDFETRTNILKTGCCWK